LRVICADENSILQDLLKSILLSEMFTQCFKRFNQPYIKWKDLDDFQFKIPAIEIQKEIAGVINGILSSIEGIKNNKIY
jgi:restriction endonuclease S subunit